MVLREIMIRRLKLPLRKPYKVSFRTYTEFEPIFVHLRDEDGCEGWGEAHSPVGSMSETPDTVWRLCCDQAPMLLGRPVDEVKRLIDRHLASAPNAVTALTTAVEMLERNPMLSVEREIHVPLLVPVGAHDRVAIAEEVERHLAEGYRTLKVKVGWDVETDLARVDAVRAAAAGRADITIDANRAFGQDDGCRFVQGLAPDGIKLFEQPCAADAWNANGAVAKLSRVPLMLDESIKSPLDIDRAAGMENVRFVKLKLKRTGGLERARASMQRARDLGLVPAFGDGVTSELDCWMSACVAHGTDGMAGEMNGYLKTTARLFTEPLSYRRGAVILKPGFWPSIDPSALDAHTVESRRIAPTTVMGVQI